jgi:glycosyltransferase involved in cell wall biosynthesis
MNPTSETWHLVTGEYPPDTGGVADYTARLAAELTAGGCAVHVWSSGSAAVREQTHAGFTVHRIAGRFGLRGLLRLDRELNRLSRPRTILVQYTPQAFGLKAMNILFCLWILVRRVRSGDDVRIMFHEVAMPFVRRPLRWNLIAAINRVMAMLLIRAASVAYVSIPAWEPMLRRLGGRRLPIVWTPVPANVPAEPQLQTVAAVRARLVGEDLSIQLIGHFGTFGSSITTLLDPTLAAVLSQNPDRVAVLIGRGSEEFLATFNARHPGLANRVMATGGLPAVDVSAHLAACDVLLQPYCDGVSTRRTSVMAGLAVGVPVVTNLGPLSEPLWASDGQVALATTDSPVALAKAVEGLLARSAIERRTIGEAARRWYAANFALERTVAILCSSLADRRCHRG